MTGAGKAFRIVSPGPGRKAACTNGRGMLCLMTFRISRNTPEDTGIIVSLIISGGFSIGEFRYLNH